MDQFTPIADRGLIGDLQMAALVTTDGAIDFYCCPRFVSPTVFAALLDRQRGGLLRIAPPDGADVEHLHRGVPPAGGRSVGLGAQRIAWTRNGSGAPAGRDLRWARVLGGVAARCGGAACGTH